MRGILGMQVLWNKSNIVLDMPTPVSQPSQPSSSPPGDPDDDNDNAGGPGSNPLGSLPPDNSNP